MTGHAVRQFATNKISWHQLVQHTWVYARVSPAQKEFILTTLKSLGYVTLMAGDGTNDVGALKQANIGVALLNGTEEDLKAIVEHQKKERAKKLYEQQLRITSRFGQPPPPVPPLIADLFPDAVKAQQEAAKSVTSDRQRGKAGQFDTSAIMSQLSEMEDSEVPQIKLGDASVAAPFTSKLANVAAITHIIRQGRCTLTATIQMYKILALNCLISAWALSVQYLQGIKFGDYQVTITGMLMSVCFMTISRARVSSALPLLGLGRKWLTRRYSSLSPSTSCRSSAPSRLSSTGTSSSRSCCSLRSTSGRLFTSRSCATKLSRASNGLYTRSSPDRG